MLVKKIIIIINKFFKKESGDTEMEFSIMDNRICSSSLLPRNCVFLGSFLKSKTSIILCLPYRILQELGV